MVSQDFKEFLISLNDNQVRYLIVGGYAVAFHGYPRYTKEMDIWIEVSPNNADNIVKALDQFGFSSLGLKAEDFLQPDTIIQLGYPPNRIDLITTLPGINFETCYEEKIVTLFDGLLVNFIDLESLKRNKKATGRTQDLADFENL